MSLYLSGPSGARTRYLVRVESPRMRGWVELESASRHTAKVECADAFRSRGVVVTLYERAADGMGYIKVGVIVAPANQTEVEGSKSLAHAHEWERMGELAIDPEAVLAGEHGEWTAAQADLDEDDEERCDHPRVEGGRCAECGERCSRRDVGATGPLCHDPECPIHGI